MVYLQRKVYFELKKHLKQKEISLILGPRQSGKTTLMRRLSDELKLKGIPSAFYNLDIIEDKLFFESQHTLVNQIQRQIGQTNEAVVFIDEIHRIKNPGLFLKGLYDLNTTYKFIASGSGSLELREDIIEPLTGRKKVFYCLPLSFEEFAAHRFSSSFENLNRALDLNRFDTARAVRDYLKFGGYPRVIVSQTDDEKRDILIEIFKSYLEKDIQLLLKVEKDLAFQNLVRALASQIGNLVNFHNLSVITGLKQETVKKYIYLLEKTFVIKLVGPYYRNSQTEVKKSPKVYFCDLGLLTLARSAPTPLTHTSGDVFENAVFLRINENKLLDEVRFWRSLSGAEVDFVIHSPKTGEIIPVESKLNSRGRGLGKSLSSFIRKYKPSKAYFYTLENSGQFTQLGVKISIIPYHQPLCL